MRRTFKIVVKEGAALLAEDIRRQKWAVLAIAAYFIIAKQFMYSLCPMVTVTGFPCPACGLSRAGFSLLRGRFQLAFEIHPFIYPIAFLIVLFFVYRYILKKNTQILKTYLTVLIIAMVIYYIYRMIRYFPSDPPMSFYYNNYIQGVLNFFRSH